MGALLIFALKPGLRILYSIGSSSWRWMALTYRAAREGSGGGGGSSPSRRDRMKQELGNFVDTQVEKYAAKVCFFLCRGIPAHVRKTSTRAGL